MHLPADRPNPCEHETDETQTEENEHQKGHDEGDITETHVAHGIDLNSGEPIAPPRTWAELRQCVLATYQGREPELERRADTLEEHGSDQGHRGQPPAGVEPGDLASAGWGVVFATDIAPAARKALQPLLDHREQQAGKRFGCEEERTERPQKRLDPAADPVR